MIKPPDIVKIQEICMGAILQNKSADEFVQDLYSVLKLPIIVFDETISLISYAFQRPYYFKDWDEIAQFGSSPKKKIADYVLDDYQKIILSNKKPTLINWGTCSENPQICCPIMHEGFLYGYIGIALDDCPFTDEVMEISQLSADVLSCLLDFAYKKSGADVLTPEEFAEKLLTNDSPSQSMLRAYSSKYKPCYTVCILTLSHPNDAKLKYTLGYILKHMKNAVACSYDNRSIYILLSDLDMRLFSENCMLIENIANQQGFITGISDYFYDISLLSSRKIQAMRTNTVGHILQPKEDMFMFRNLYFDIVCCHYLERLDNTASVPYALRKLAAADENGQKNYIETLSCYIEHFLKLSDTAEALGVHPNTVRFRMERIYEILGSDLKQPEEVHNIYCGLRLLKIIKKYRNFSFVKPAFSEE